MADAGMGIAETLWLIPPRVYAHVVLARVKASAKYTARRDELPRAAVAPKTCEGFPATWWQSRRVCATTLVVVDRLGEWL